MLIDTILQKLAEKKYVYLEYDGETNQWQEARQSEAAGSDYLLFEFGKAVYSGKLKNGKPSGYGTLRLTSSSGGWYTEYRGFWKDGRYHGLGREETVNSSHSNSYTGMYKNGLKHGPGSEHGSFYEHKGWYKNDNRL